MVRFSRGCLTLFTTLFFLFLISDAIAGDSLPDVRLFSVDRLGNIYIIRNDELIRYNESHQVTARFSRKDLGAPTSIDTRNPLRILVFYRDFGTVRILDNQLSEQSTANLRTLNILEPAFIAGSADQGLWVYDQSTAQLIKLDRTLRSTALSIDLRLLLGKDPAITGMEVNDNWIALKANGQALIFDQFGTMSRKIPLNCAPTLFQLIQDQFVCNCGATTLFPLRNAGLEPRTMDGPPPGVSACQLVNGNYYWLQAGWLHLP